MHREMIPTLVLEVAMVAYAVELVIKIVLARRRRRSRWNDLPSRYRVADDLDRPYAEIVEAAEHDAVAEQVAGQLSTPNYDVVRTLMFPTEPLPVSDPVPKSDYLRHQRYPSPPDDPYDRARVERALTLLSYASTRYTSDMTEESVGDTTT